MADNPSPLVSRTAKVRIETLEQRTMPATLVIDVGGNLVYTATAGKLNNVALVESGGNYVLSDSAETITVSGPGSTAWSGSGSKSVTGPTSSIASLVIRLGDQNDTASILNLDVATIEGGAGTDRIDVAADADATLTNTSLAIVGRPAIALVGLESARIVGGAGDNLLDASAFVGAVTLSGLAGNDTLLGGGKNDSLDGGAGNDLATGGLGNDTFAGGTGLDRIVETANVNFTLTNISLIGVGTDVLSGVESAFLTGGAGNNLLNASAFTLGPVTLVGAGGNDTLRGGAGNDELSGGIGNDNIAGGAGVNRLVESGDVSLVLTPTSLSGLGTDILAQVQQASLTGGASNNTLNVSAFSGSVTLDGGAGNDTVQGGSGDDQLTGGANDDSIVGNGGIDRLVEAADANFVLTATALTGAGNDTLSSIESASLSGGATNNSLDATAFAGPVTLQGLGGDDTLLGGTGNDLLSGGTGADTVDGGTGTFDVAAGSGEAFTLTNLTLSATSGVDTLAGIESASLVGGAGDELLDASLFSLGSVTIDGAAGNDTIIGTGSDDVLTGSAGNDTINGAGGNDAIIEQADANFTLADAQLTGQGTDLLVSIEQAQLTGGFANNSFTVDGFTGLATLAGGEGNDVVIGTRDTNTTLSATTLTYQSGGSFNLLSIDQALLTGGNGNNLIDASSATIPVVLQGLDGNDTLVGGSKNDSIVGGAGNDFLSGLLGNDTLQGGVGEDSLGETGNVNMTLTPTSLVGLGTDSLADIESASLVGGVGNNTINAVAFTGQVSLYGLGGNDKLVAGLGGSVLDGAQGNDTLTGGAGIDILLGGAGNDVLAGGANQDRILEIADVSFTLTNAKLTGNGTDTVSGVEEAMLIAGAGNNVLDASKFSGVVTLDGGAGHDRLMGAIGAAGDSLIGGAGNDTLTGNAGDDTVVGGQGVDLLTESGNVDFTLTDSALTGPFNDVISGIESASITGGAGNNVINASTFSGNVTLDGGAGNDTVRGGSGNDQLTGGTGNDSIDGGVGIDVLRESANANLTLTATALTGIGTDTLSSIDAAILIGGTGNNTINASTFTGPVTMDGGTGNDSLVGGLGNDLFTSGLGNDTINGGAGTNEVRESADMNFVLTPTLLTGVGTDRLTNISAAKLVGGAKGNLIDASTFTGSVTLDGGAGNDTLRGGSANDQLTGGSGNDSISGAGGSDLIAESANANLTLTNTTLTGAGTDTLASIELASLAGGAGNNAIDASAFAGPVTLDGGAGNDTLTGTSSGDQLTGGLGDDVLTGGLGTNLLFESADVSMTLTDTQLVGPGTDTLSNLQRIHLVGGDGANLIDASGFTLGPVVLIGGDGNDTLIGTSTNDSLTGGLGNDSISGGTGGVDTLIDSGNADIVLTTTGMTGLGIDVLTGIESAILTGGNSGNVLSAVGFTSGPVTLDGGIGDDTLSGGPSNDELIGGPGSDVVSAIGDVNMTLTDTSLVGSGTDVLSGIERAYLEGGTSANALDASAFTLGSVTLRGGLGDDTLTGGTSGADVLDEQGDVNMTLTNSALTGLGTDVLAGIESARLVGGNSADVLNASSFSLGPVTLTGGLGDDTLTGGATAGDVLAEQGDANFTLATGSLSGVGLDTFSGLESVSLTGGASDNIFTVSGWTATATLSGGAGNDRVVSANNANMTLTDASLTRSTPGSFVLASIEEAALTGGSGNNALDASGFNGKVTLSGGTGQDTLTGGPGVDDVVSEFISSSVNYFNSFFFGPTLSVNFTDDSIPGIENLLLVGGGGANTFDLLFFPGNSTITGGLGNDTIKGSLGRTRLVESGDTSFTVTNTGMTGNGTDTLEAIDEVLLTGGASANVFDFSGWSGDASVNGSTGTDRIVAGGDVDFTLTATALTRTGRADVVLSSIEGASLIGGAASNDFDVTAWAGPVTVDGGASGFDVVVDAADTDFTLTDALLAVAGKHTVNLSQIDGARLTGGSSANLFDASTFSGAVTLDGGFGADRLESGLGDADLRGGADADVYELHTTPGSRTIAITDEGGLDTVDLSSVGFGVRVDLSSNTGGAQSLGTGSTLQLTGAIESIIGTELADVIIGDQFGNNIEGLNGNDTLTGQSGIDTLVGGLGNDSIDGGADSDQLSGNAGEDTLVGGAGHDSLSGGIDNDLLTGGEGNDTVLGDDGVDRYGGEPETLTEPGDDLVDMGTGNDLAIDTLGNNVLFGGTGNDLLIAGAGNDIVYGSDNEDTLTGGVGDDTLDGGPGIDRLVETVSGAISLTNVAMTGLGTDELVAIDQVDLTGSTGADQLDASAFTTGPVTLDGAAGNDTLLGGSGNDLLIPGTGDDVVDGNGGSNTLIVFSNANLTITDTSLVGDGADTLADIQQAQLNGGDANNTIDASAFSGSATLVGGGGNDLLTGGAGNDVLTGGEGNDTLNGGAGTNQLSEVADANLTLTTTALTGLGTDVLSNIQQASLIVGGVVGRSLNASAFTGAVTLIGGAGNDTLVGGSGNDVLSGRFGNDSIAGGTGTNQLQDFGDVSFVLTNTLLTGLGTDTLSGIQSAVLFGGDGDNTINASGFTAGPVTLAGGAGNDSIVGSPNDDTLDGGDGSDTIDGGLGTDIAIGESMINVP